ncbi:MAG TPA: methyltransferase domain-containing protein [Longimicrobiales bacterium]|nr:methyltransferase domain-containing protein [Longimicrobiales bacterium]
MAPERAVAERLRSWDGVDYLSGDLRPGRAMVALDVTDIDRPEGSFEGVWCSHVLEHVPDDRAAMAEFYRVLAPNGWAVVLVPITAPRTVEDPSVRSPRKRRRLFGQHDHVRRYGPDIADRLAEAGFGVEVVRPSDVAGEAERRRHLLPADDQPLFFCRKPGHAS